MHLVRLRIGGVPSSVAGGEVCPLATRSLAWARHGCTLPVTLPPPPPLLLLLWWSSPQLHQAPSAPHASSSAHVRFHAISPRHAGDQGLGLVEGDHECGPPAVVPSL